MTLFPTLSVILVSYHSQHDLEQCLPSLTCSSPMEVIIVDNDPQDGTSQWLSTAYPDIHVIASSNSGYGAACNLGMKHARGQFWCVLNPDTQLYPGALDTLLETSIAHPDALITPALLQPSGIVNAYGNTMHITGITTCDHFGDAWTDSPRFYSPLLASGAAIMAPRNIWERLGGFDPSYFLYMEDADLSLRARLQGLTVICDTRARIMHDYTLNLTAEKFYWLERNRWRTLLTTYSTRTLITLTIPLIATEIATWAYALLKGPQYVSAHLRVYLWLFRNHAVWRVKRVAVQRSRTISDATLLAEMETAYPLNQLISARWLAHHLSRWSARFFGWFGGKKVALR
ncbi:MAG: glycosyltransferase family 2 protein [Sulfobacillus thermotolerans]|nr:glycosyltransferase family 2 protein [Sulfobacillus thermotolerans]